MVFSRESNKKFLELDSFKHKWHGIGKLQAVLCVRGAEKDIKHPSVIAEEVVVKGRR